MTSFERVFCHDCRTISIQQDRSAIPRSPDGQYLCPRCHSELVEFVETDEQAAELMSFQRQSNPPPTHSPQQLYLSNHQAVPFSLFPPPLIANPAGQHHAAIIVHQGPHVTRMVQTIQTTTFPDGRTIVNSSGPISTLTTSLGSDSNRAPSLADLLRQEINLVQRASMGAANHEHFFVNEDPNAMRTLMHRILMQHEPHAQPTPPQVISSLVSRQGPLTAEERAQMNDEPCVICHEEMWTNSDEARMCLLQLPCGHWYHDGCIRPWLEMSTTCPSCRRSLLM